jgi:hypothetical protein
MNVPRAKYRSEPYQRKPSAIAVIIFIAVHFRLHDTVLNIIMSASAKKPVATSSPLGRRGSADPSLTSPSARRGSPTPGSTASTNGTVARTRSIRTGTPVSARAAMHRSTTSTSNLSQSAAASETDDEARAETVALLDELKEQLRNSELRAADFEKQNEVLQLRLDETLLEQSKLEDRLHEMEERNEILLNEKREASRQIQQMESIYEAERVAMTKEKEDFANREEEMLTIIQRLKDSLSQRTTVDDESRMSRHCTCYFEIMPLRADM